MRSKCTIPDCGKLHAAHGLCSTHYYRLKRTGTLAPRSRPTPAERFWAKVDKSGECWLWLGARGGSKKRPYGLFSPALHVMTGAHRWAYASAKGPIPDGLTIDHLCRQTLCVNPDHLEPVTMQENILRGTGVSVVNAAKAKCYRGHPFDDSNTYRKPNGERVCRTCKNEVQREYRRSIY